MSKVDKNDSLQAMDDKIDPSRRSLWPLFPDLIEEELKVAESTFYGYLEIVRQI
jgi:hypothetical protein